MSDPDTHTTELARARTGFEEDEEYEHQCCKCCRCCDCLWNSLCCCLCRNVCSCITWFTFCAGIRCCCCSAKGGNLFLKLEKNRYSTDVACGLMFIVALIIQLILFATAIPDSDPRWLVYYADWNGSLCGPRFEAENLSSTVAAWPDIRMYDVVVCLDYCNQTETDSRMVTPPFSTNTLDNYSLDDGTYDYITGYESMTVFKAYCLPDPGSSDFQIVSFKDSYSKFVKKFDSLATAIDLAIGDITILWPMLIVTAATAVGISFAYGILLRYCAPLIIWGSIAFVAICLAMIGGFFVDFSADMYLFGYDTIGDFLFFSGWAIIIFDVLFVLAVLAMQQRIRLAIALSQETTRALGSAPQMVLFPLVPIAWVAIYSTYWVFGALAMGSVTETFKEDFPLGAWEPYYKGGPTLADTLGLGDDSQINSLKVVDKWLYAVAYHFFMLLWMNAFITYSTVLVFAGIFAEWYFSEWTNDKENAKKRGEAEGEFSKWPVWSSFRRTVRYHLGTVAFASLLIAIVEFIDYAITYFEKQVMGQEPSKLQKVLLAAVHCLLDCIEWVLDKINRNGLIITAIYGWPLCAASGKGLYLIFRNVIRAAALGMVQGYLKKVGQLAIVSANVVVFVLCINYIYGETISSLVFPAILAAVISVTVAWQWLNLYEVGIQTIFMCFLIDEEHNAGGHMVCSKRLYKVIGEQTVSREALKHTARSKRHLLRHVEEGIESKKTGKHLHKKPIHKKGVSVASAGMKSTHDIFAEFDSDDDDML